MEYISIFFIFIILCLFIINGYGATWQHSVSYPIRVHVWLAGFQNDPDYTWKLSSLVQEILPTYYPEYASHADAHQYFTKRFQIQFKFQYDVNLAHNKVITDYGKIISNSPIDMNGSRLVNMIDIINFLDDATTFNSGLLPSNFSEKSNLFSLSLLLLYHKDLPKHRITRQSIDKDQTSCTQSVLSSIAFIDLSASSCDLHSFLNTPQSTHIRSSIPIMSHPWPFTYISDKFTRWSHPKQYEYRETLLLSRLAGIVTSSIQSLSTGTLQKTSFNTAEKIFCPIIVLQNQYPDTNISIAEFSRNFNNIIEVKKIQRFVQSILQPHQKLIILHTQRLVGEYPQIAVALASAEMTYTSIKSEKKTQYPHPPPSPPPNSTTTSTSNYQIITESIPYIDSEIFMRELSQIGDNLINKLLGMSGYKNDITSMNYHNNNNNNNIRHKALNEDEEYDEGDKKDDVDSSATSELEDWLDEAVDLTEDNNYSKNILNNNDNDKDKDKLHTLHRLHNPIAVLPVFVLSDLHTHIQTKSPPASSSSSIPTSQYSKFPIQPLLNKEKVVAVTEKAVVILHSSNEMVLTYSQSTQSWQSTNMSDVNSQIALGLSQSLVGLSPPHEQILKTRKTIDLTWTHGDHPFPPFGSLTDTSLSPVLVGTARRGVILSRITSVLHQAEHLRTTSTTFLHQLLTAILVLHGVTNNSSTGTNTSPLKNKSNLQPDSLSIIGSLSSKSEIIKNLPNQCLQNLIFVEELLSNIESRINELITAISNSDESLMVLYLSSLENDLFGMKVKLRKHENELKEQLSFCYVDFDFSNNNLNNDRNDYKIGVSKRIAFFSSTLGLVVTFILLIIFLVIVVVVLNNVQEWMEMKAKKIN